MAISNQTSSFSASATQADTTLTPPGNHQLRLIDRIKHLLKEKDATLVAHYYTSGILQQLAEDTGGFVSDSLDMARFGTQTQASTLVVAGVRFMGETAKILNPEKRILMPSLEATCSLDLGCPADSFSKFCDAHPEHTVVVYANTSAAVKARADWAVTSAIALDIVSHLKDEGKKIIWAPDKHLGNYIQKETGADMLLWDGSCIVHDEFKERELRKLKDIYPDAAVLVHPESPAAIIELADAVGSTTALIKAATQLPNKRFIVATDKGIFYKMRQANPGKEFIEAPTGGVGASCRSCAACPWMSMNALENLADTLEHGHNEVFVDENIRQKAIIPLQRMLDFAAEQQTKIYGQGKA